jgi:hypothetical protein
VRLCAASLPCLSKTDTNSCAYYNTISWRDESTPLPMENQPDLCGARPVSEFVFDDAVIDQS